MSPCFFILAWKNHTYGKGVVMADWAKIKAEYIRGGISTRKLAEKHGVSYATLRRHCEKEHWVEHERKNNAAKTRKIVDACATREAKKACKEIEAATMLLDKLVEAITGIQPEELDSLYTAASVLQKIKDAKKGLTDLDLQEQEARIAKLRREAEREDAEKSIEIVMPPELRRFCQ